MRSPAEGVAYIYEMEQKIEELEGQLAFAKALKRKAETEVVPELFDRADVVKTETEAGVAATKKLYVEGSLPKAGERDTPEEAAEKESRRQRAIAWATANGWGPFIKRSVILAFDKGDEEGAEQVLRFVRGMNSCQPTIKVDEGIHAQTLQSQARKRLEQGLDLPLDDLGLTALTAVKITKRPKK